MEKKLNGEKCFVNPAVNPTVIALGYTRALFRLNITILDSIILKWEK